MKIYSPIFFLITLIIIPGELYCGNTPKRYSYNKKGNEAIEKEDYLSAIRYYKDAFSHEPENSVIKENLATAYNNYAIKLSRKKSRIAKGYLLKALQLFPESKVYKGNIVRFYLNEAVEKYNQKDYRGALRNIDDVLKYEKNNFEALDLKGTIYYYKQDLERAKLYWEEALEAKPGSSNIKEKLANLKKEILIEGDFEGLKGLHFDIKFDQESVEYDAYDIRDYLQRAYRDIGQHFNYFPKGKIIAIVYSREKFRELRADSPEWVGGLYDGKIRLPVLKGFKDEKIFKRVLWHEYAHVVINDLSKGRCPLWLNEGIAKYEESRVDKPPLRILRERVREGSILMSISQLSHSLRNAQIRETVELAYDEAFTIVEYIVERYGFWKVREMLKELAKGNKIEEVIRKKFYMDMEKFEKRWREFVEKRYNGGR